MTKRELTDQQKKFLEALFGEAKGNPAHARKIAGYSEGYNTRDIMNSLKDEVLELTRLHLALNGPKAAFAMIESIEDPTELGVKEKMVAAKDVLDRIGIVKTEKVQVEAGNGLMILPAKDAE
jgi:hypothetical protein